MPTSAPSDAAVWDAAETLPRAELADAPARAGCARPLHRVLRADGLGARRLADAGVAAPTDIGSLADLAGIPFMTKADLRDQYPFGLLAVPREELVRVHASSGTHGKPTVVGYTRADLDTWTELMARCMTMAGVRPGMLIHNANGYGLFTGGLGFHQGGERIGATVVPVSGGFTARQALLLRDLGAQVLVSTPVVRARDRAGGARQRPRPAVAGPCARAVRRRAVDRGAAGRDRAGDRPEGDELLRPVGDVRPRSGCRVPGRRDPGCTCRRTTSSSR